METMEARKEAFTKSFTAFCNTVLKAHPLEREPLIVQTTELQGEPPQSDAWPEFYKVPYMDLVGLEVEDEDEVKDKGKGEEKEEIEIVKEEGGEEDGQDKKMSESVESVSAPVVVGRAFFRREAVRTIWEKIETLPDNKVVFFQGQPGTGKSTAVWRKVLDMALNDGKILWISLERSGELKAVVYFLGKSAFTLHIMPELIDAFIVHCEKHHDVSPLNFIVIDGMCEKDVARKIYRYVRAWLTTRIENRRAALTASTKVEKERDHQNTLVDYATVHSWTEGEYFRALVNNDRFTQLYLHCSHLLKNPQDMEDSDDEDSDDEEEQVEDENETTDLMDLSSATNPVAIGAVAPASSVKPAPVNQMAIDTSITLSEDQKKEFREIIVSRMKYAGGSARWMFNYTEAKIDEKLIECCDSVANRAAILDGQIGPTSSASSNFMFGSQKTANGKTEFFLVSQRAVEILLEKAKGKSFGTLYAFANALKNPAFAGWVVEADFFMQLRNCSKMGQNVPFTPRELEFLPAERIVKFDHTKNRNRLATLYASATRAKTKKALQEKVKRIAGDLIPSTRNVSVACSPVLWNQGGYDIFFVEAPNSPEDQSHLRLKFGQITKGENHSFKGGFIFTVISFFEQAGYTIDSVGFTFILTNENFHTFELKKSEVEGASFLAKYRMCDSPGNWNTAKLQDCVGKCTMNMST